MRNTGIALPSWRNGSDADFGSMVWKQWETRNYEYRELRQRGIAAQDAAKDGG